MDDSLEIVFEDLRRLLSTHIPPFKPGGDEQEMFRGKKQFHLVAPKTVVIQDLLPRPDTGCDAAR
jgi:hypothetical protein